jgi:hypothetical protein
VNSQVPSKVFGGEGPQLAWGEESAKRSGRVRDAPQGENVLDASMMAELIVTKKEIVPQLTKVHRNLAGGTKSPGEGGQRLTLAERLRAERWILWFLGLGALLAARFTASVRTPVEGKIGADTAAWTRVTQGHSQDWRHGKAPAERLRWPQYGLQGKLLQNSEIESSSRPDGMSSRLEGFHPRPLTEPYVSLSAHTALTGQPLVSTPGSSGEQIAIARGDRSQPAICFAPLAPESLVFPHRPSRQGFGEVVVQNIQTLRAIETP